MTEGEKTAWHDGIEEIVSDTLRFKARLAIGEDAYTSIRITKKASEMLQGAAAAGTFVIGASSTLVASTFFGPTGTLAFLGIGTAVTPVGWLIAAGIVGGGGWIGVSRYIKRASGSRVISIPEFINNPVDMLALSLFDLIAPLALKVAATDDDIDPAEREAISWHFIKDWGFDPTFVQKGMAETERRLPEFSVEALARTLAEFKKCNKDCHYEEMSRELISFLRQMMAADGRIDHREEAAIEEIQAVFKDVACFKFNALRKKTSRDATSTPNLGSDSA